MNTSFRETISIQVRTRSSVAISSEPQRDSETGLKIQLSFAVNKGNNKITELRTILQRESPNS